MYEEPPLLPFPSLNILKGEAKDILNTQRNPTTPDVEFKFFSHPVEYKKPKGNKKPCHVCKKKKKKCDVNNMENEVCERQSGCPCIYHRDIENSSDGSNQKVLPALHKPGLLHSGHYTGETSFCAYLDVGENKSTFAVEETFPAPMLPPCVPSLTLNDQLYLIDVYYDNINSFFPIVNKSDISLQVRAFYHSQPGYLSPLFFYALFARAATFIESQYSEHNRPFHLIAKECMDYAIYLRPSYQDRSRLSTILALVIMSQHMEQTKLHENLTQAWLWSGEAFRSALDLGIHRSIVSSELEPHGQLSIRTFWLAFMADCTISMTYGRPNSTEEKVLDVPQPTCLSQDDEFVREWLEHFTSSITLCKIAARVIRFNYSPPPPFNIPGPIKRHNAFLASVDSWLTDIINPSRDESKLSVDQQPKLRETTTSSRLELEKRIFLLVNLMLLHRPYIYDIVRGNHSRPSYDIYSYAAIIVTDRVYRLDNNELFYYHAKSPIIVYALVIALSVHIMNAATPSLAEKFNADKNYNYCIETLYRLPQCVANSSIVSNSVQELQEQYQNKSQDGPVTPVPIIVPDEIKTAAKRKEEQSPTIKQYQHGKKKKKGKSATKKEKEATKKISANEIAQPGIVQQHQQLQQPNFIPDELQFNIDPYQQFYNQFLLQDDGLTPTDYSFDFINQDIQEYTVGLEADLGVSIQLVSNNRQQ
ncbi:fungal-specific transcription factor domain-containing protein [Sporodiniella umbellata]|nr:fungal-specific transcription factor domain-containing protein [Sporodiniella umbellata]